MYYFAPFFHLAKPTDGTQPPRAQAPALGYAMLDGATGMVTVRADADGEPAYVRINPDHLAGGANILSCICYELARAGAPIFPTRLYRLDSLPYPWDADEDDLRTARAANGEATVPMVGYVADADEGKLVYLHIVGAKSAVRSIWATINNGGNNCKPVHLDDPAQYQNVYGSKNYVTYSAPVVQETGDYRLLIVDRRVTSPEVADVAYLIVHREDGAEGDGLYRAFAARLNAVLPIPILPEWGERLYQTGLEERLVRPCACGGDVSAAFAIANDPHWLGVVESLLQSGDLAL